MHKHILIAACAVAVFSADAMAEFQRGYIRIVGSNAVVPFAKAVGERYAKAKKAQIPLIESTSTGGGIKLFCEGASGETPDVAVSSRALKPKERDECQQNGVADILELKIGYDGLILAQSKQAPALNLSRKEAWLALAKWVVGTDGKPVQNPHQRWKDINPAFPDQSLEILGPPPTSGAYDALVDMLTENQCKASPWLAAGQTEPSADALRKCRALREDGVYVEGREDDEGQVLRVANSPAKVAVVDYQTLVSHAGQLRAIPIDEVTPSADTIANRAYAGARPLFVYVKAGHFGQVPGLKDYVAEFASEKTWGDNGYLPKLGLIAMLSSERASYVDAVKGFGIAPSLAAAEGKATKAAKPGKATKPAKSAAKTKPVKTAS